MTPMDTTDLSQLVNATDGRLVSLYMPMHHGAEARQNPVRLDNLLRTAETALREGGLRGPDAQRLLEPGRRLVDQLMALESTAQSLAAFLARDGTRTRELSFECPESCTVGKHYFILPLLNWLAENVRYYVLAVSQNSVKLFHGTRDELHEKSVEGLPVSLGKALNYDDPEAALQAGSARMHLPRKEGLTFHGYGGAPDVSKEEIVAFFREIDRALADDLRQTSDPLVFAGVDYLFPLYQEVSSYAHLLPRAISGNPELWTDADLRQRAWPLVATLPDDRRKAALDRYGNSISQDRALDEVEAIIIAAHAGAVDTLLIDPTARQLGAFDADKYRVRLNENPQPDSEDLINLAATLVMRNSGAVEPLAADDVPGGDAMAAILRYPFSPRSDKMQAAAQKQGSRG